MARLFEVMTGAAGLVAWYGWCWAIEQMVSFTVSATDLDSER